MGFSLWVPWGKNGSRRKPLLLGLLERQIFSPMIQVSSPISSAAGVVPEHRSSHVLMQSDKGTRHTFSKCFPEGLYAGRQASGDVTTRGS